MKQQPKSLHTVLLLLCLSFLLSAITLIPIHAADAFANTSPNGSDAQDSTTFQEHRYTTPTFDWNGDICVISYSCSVCKDTFADECYPTEERIYDNCTAPGILRQTVSITLNSVLYSESRESELPSKKHTAVAVLGKDPTCTDSGLTDGFICSDCGTVIAEQEEIPAPGHKEAVILGTAATCTEPGISNGILCSVCNTILTPQTQLPAAGHSPVTENAKPASCTEHGTTGTTTCSVCKSVLQESAGIPATGHSFGAVVFDWNSDSTAASASKSCTNGCGTTLQGNVTVSRNEIKQNGKAVIEITASASFADGSTAVDRRTQNVDPAPDPEPSIPQTPSDASGSGQPALKFDDVAPDTYYYDAVLWASRNHITQGTDERIFSPDSICTRAQIVTMLWRAAGSPMVNQTIAFDDVPEASYYYHAVVWASDAGITAGTTQTTFSPDEQCSRAQVVTMLWRAAGCPTIQSPAQFSDVAADTWYIDAVSWAVQNQITLGTGNKAFSPDAVCTRAQIVTFLYRARNTLFS